MLAGFHQAGIGQEFVHAIRRHRALGDPGLGGIQVQLDAVGMIRRQQRIVEADLLDEAAVARIAAVGDDDVLVRTLLGAATGKTNAKSHCIFPSVVSVKTMRT